MIDIVKQASIELGIKEHQVSNTLALLDEGATVPFISRYRKEMTGSLDEEQIRNIQEKTEYLRNLEKRKEDVIKSIEEQGKLTDALKHSIEKAVKLQEVEDLYLPYKKKKKTKADVARENGLEPLSKMFYEVITAEMLYKEAEKYINENVPDINSAVEGAGLIIAEAISENVSYREYIREELQKSGIVNSKLIEKNSSKDEKKVFLDYYQYSEEMKKMPSHRILALNRGENEDILKVGIDFSSNEKIYAYIFNREFKKSQIAELLGMIIEDSCKRLIFPSIEREVRNIMTEKAEKDAILIFKYNLRNLLMQPPISDKVIFGIDPGFRTGCKLAVINKLGFYEKIDVIYLEKEQTAKEKIIDFIKKYNVDIIAIGNGTASRETEKIVAEILNTEKFEKKVFYLIVNEAGASVYSASKAAKDEFPELDVTARGTISIARRVQDPLAELVKIDTKSIGVGMYQHDVNQKVLNESLTEVVESVVNSVGVNINTASHSLLEYVSGIKKDVAKNILEYRSKNGKFNSRNELKKVKGLGDKMFMLSAGFIVIPDGKNPLDNTIIHPESYGTAEKLLKENGFGIESLNSEIKEVREKLKNFDYNRFAKDNNIGIETINDIYNAIVRDRRDPRDTMPQPLLKSDILKIEDLKDGMILEGTVRNVTSFGAFVDIGLKNDALLHISEMGDKFIKNPMEIVSVGDIVKITVKSVDMDRGRVSLTMKTARQ